MFNPPPVLPASFLCGALLLLLAPPARAQSCTYDACAIRLHYGRGRPTVVRGVQAEPVSRGGVWYLRVPVLDSAGPVVAGHYSAYRHHAARGGWLRLAALVPTTAALVAWELDRDRQVRALPIVLVSVGFVTSLVAERHARRGAEHFAQALWEYNRAFAR